MVGYFFLRRIAKSEGFTGVLNNENQYGLKEDRNLLVINSHFGAREQALAASLNIPTTGFMAAIN